MTDNKRRIHELHVFDRTKNVIYGIDNSELTITNAKKKSQKHHFCNVMRAKKLDLDDFFKLLGRRII